jgi:hypothetical protein
MATVKRTTSTTISRTPPPLPQDEPPQRLASRLPNAPGQLPDEPPPPDNQWPGVEPEEVEPGAPAQSDVVPVGVEQFQRSQEMQAMGIHNWVAAHDERNLDEPQQQVAGVIDYERR